MKTKQGLFLRKVGMQYRLVDSATGDVNLTNVYTMNQTAAMLWEHIGDNEFDVDSLTDWLCDIYDVEHEVAKADVKLMVEEWKHLGLIV